MMSILIRKMPVVPYTMMYAPRGPVCDVHDKETIMELTKKVKELAKKHNVNYLLIDDKYEFDIDL